MIEPSIGTKYKISLAIDMQKKNGSFITFPLRIIRRIFTGQKRRAIEIIHGRTGNNKTALEYIELDLSRLQPGHAVLTVFVTDLLRNRQVSSSIEFNLE